MTKKQFLKRLNAGLRALKRAERKKYMADYSEMLSDLMENGLSEEEAVESLGDAAEIAGELLESAGSGGLRRLDVPGTVLITVSAVLTALSLYERVAEHTVWNTLSELLSGLGFSSQFQEGGSSIGIIGGADGPTSIFLAGKIGNSPSVFLYGAAAVCVCATVLYFIRKWKKQK